MPDLTLAEMAREIERRRKGSLPKSVWVERDIHDCDDKYVLIMECVVDGIRGEMYVPDDIAHCVLRVAMVMATNATRDSFGWGVMVNENKSWCDAIFADADHGGCPTRSLFAAFCAVFPEVAP